MLKEQQDDIVVTLQEDSVFILKLYWNEDSNDGNSGFLVICLKLICQTVFPDHKLEKAHFFTLFNYIV